MPSAKIPSTLTPSSNKSKRKRVGETTDVVTTPTVVEKPPKKARSSNTIDVPSNPPASQSTRPSSKTSKKDKLKKPEDGAGTPKKRTEKTVTFSESVSNDGQGTRKAKKKHLDADPPAADEDRDELKASAAPEAVEEEEIHLQGFTSESDSSDEDMDVANEPALDISKLPSFSRDDEVVQRKLEMAKRHPTVDRGVIYLGRIPRGFYEDQMRTYFTQFGEVTRLRLSRNKKTGQSKHYAFIEFSSSAVAEIVSETMDNYLLLGHILKCKVIPKDQVHPELWVGANRKWRTIPIDRVVRVKQNKPRTEEQQRHAQSKLLAREKKKRSKIQALGIDYDFEAVAYK